MQCQRFDSKFHEGIIEKKNYKHSAYESADDQSLSILS